MDSVMLGSLTLYRRLLNEARMTNDELYTLIYEHGYQYARSTTPVSQFPAIYYAHLAAARGLAHESGTAPVSENKRIDLSLAAGQSSTATAFASEQRRAQQAANTSETPTPLMQVDPKLSQYMWFV